MTQRDYEYIKAILDYGSITSASKKIYISQSALSQHIKRLEENLGVEIIKRDVSPIKLTDAGKVYFKSLEEIKAIEEETLDKIEDINNLKKAR